MNTRHPVMTGAALLLLASAAPVLARPSSKAETEATRQLNLQASQQGQVAIRSAPPQQAGVTDAAANAPANTPPAAAPTARIQTAAADPIAPPTGAMSLSSLSNPPARIAIATLRDAGGEIVGAVQKVEISSSGMPTRVSVALIGAQEKTVVFDAGTVTYDAAKNELTAQATGVQIKAMSRSG